MTVKQVGPAPGQPITTLALEAAVNDWLPRARIPSWPGALGGSSREAGDTFAVRPIQLDAIAETALQDRGGETALWKRRN